VPRSKDSTPTAPPAAPDGYSAAARELWSYVAAQFELEEHGRAVLASACTELSRAEALDAIVAAEGTIIEDRFGSPRPHPAIAAARSSRLAAARLIKLLNLNPEPANPGPGRYQRGIRR
jgi:phage terminase small subunit